MPLRLSIVPTLFVFLAVSYVLSAQTPESRYDDAVKEIAQLKRMMAEQDRRIATLERTVKSVQSTLQSAVRPVTTIPWRTAEAWAAVKIGMSRAQVVDILGEPRTTDAVMDRQTLSYRDATEAVGTVVIVDDRVAEVAATKFKITIPADQ